MTKPITSVALMMLFEEGRFQLNDPVSRFIPSWKGQRVWLEGDGEGMKTREPASPMTMRHVLSHTAGLTYGTSLFPTDHPVDKFYDKIGVNRDPGKQLKPSPRNSQECRCVMTPAPSGVTHSPQMYAVAW